MTDHPACPCFDTCVISAILKTIEIPQVLRYCAGHYRQCRYLPRTLREQPAVTRREPAEV